MRKSRAAGLLFLATATLAQQQQPVEITSEPSHHKVFENEYVCVFDVTVAPKASTLVHKHNHDYLFVTLGDSDVVSARPGEKPVALKLKDGEVRFTPGNFAHAAINNSDRPFHNTTIELLQASTNVKTCTEACEITAPCESKQAACPSILPLISSDQWTVLLIKFPPGSRLESHARSMPHLFVPVSDLELTQELGSSGRTLKRASGEVAWIAGGGVAHALVNNTTHPMQFVTVEFHPEPGSPKRAGVARDGVKEPGSPKRAGVARDGVKEPGSPKRAGVARVGVEEKP
jgi:quercetin dioxygenase-like cupin family protein